MTFPVNYHLIKGMCPKICGIPLDKGHVPENLWKLSVTYLFKDTDFPIGGFQPRFYNDTIFINFRLEFLALFPEVQCSIAVIL